MASILISFEFKPSYDVRDKKLRNEAITLRSYFQDFLSYAASKSP